TTQRHNGTTEPTRRPHVFVGARGFAVTVILAMPSPPKIQRAPGRSRGAGSFARACLVCRMFCSEPGLRRAMTLQRAMSTLLIMHFPTRRIVKASGTRRGRDPSELIG